jgi:hypothetical protein
VAVPLVPLECCPPFLRGHVSVNSWRGSGGGEGSRQISFLMKFPSFVGVPRRSIKAVDPLPRAARINLEELNILIDQTTTQSDIYGTGSSH